MFNTRGEIISRDKSASRSVFFQSSPSQRVRAPCGSAPAFEGPSARRMPPRFRRCSRGGGSWQRLRLVFIVRRGLEDAALGMKVCCVRFLYATRLVTRGRLERSEIEAKFAIWSEMRYIQSSAVRTSSSVGSLLRFAGDLSSKAMPKMRPQAMKSCCLDAALSKRDPRNAHP